MKICVPVALICALASSAFAQRGGMGAMGGMRGGPGMAGPMRGGGGGVVGVQRGFGGARGFVPGAAHGGGFGFPHRGFGGTSAFWGYGVGWGVGGYGCPYSYPCGFPYASYPLVGGYWPGYATAYPYDNGYATSQPAVTVVYAPPAPSPPPPTVVERANPVTHEYDESGREIRPDTAPANASPIYLFAFQDHTIRAASSYRVDGSTLRYVTLEREEKQAPLDTLDRALTLQLNRERRVPIQLP